MTAILPRVVAIFVLLLFCGCTSSRPAPMKPIDFQDIESAQKSADPAIYNNALNLLHDLLGDESNLSKILIIKDASPAVTQLVKNISKTAGAAGKTVESLAQSTPSRDWDRLDLPPGEKATRAAMSKIKEHALLHSSGREFEFQLLLTQADAMGYGAELARTTAENAPDLGRARELAVISDQLNQLHEDVLALLRANSY